MPDADRLAFGDFVLDRLQQRVLHRDGTTVALSPRLICALTLLIDHAGQLLDKETLIAALWPNVVVEDNNLSQVVSALRRALGDDSQDSRFIQTVPRRGFRFIAPVTPLPPSAEATSRSPPREVGDVVESRTRATAVPAATADLGTAGARHPSLGGRRRWLHLALGSAALAGVGGMGWWARHQLPLRTAADGTTLAVLPFRPLVSDGRDELLEVGMADSLIARLSLVPGLVVRSTGSIRRYAGVDQDPLRAARELEVEWIVDGSLQRRGEQLRATARLLHASNGAAAWSGTFDEQFTSVFDVQDTISTRVAEVLEPRLRADASGRAATAEVGGTRNTDAYQLYLAAARHALLLRGDGLRKALALYREALAVDPNYALAWVGLAVAYRRSFIAIDGLPAELFGHAGAAVERALAIAPNLAEALVEQAYRLYWYDFDWPAAEAVFRRAIAANPNVALARFGLATMLLNQDRPAEGFVQLRLARELDPMSPLVNALEANYLLEAGRVDEARARLQRAFDIAPNFWLAHDVLGVLELTQGHAEPAFAAMRRAVALADGSTRASAVLGGYLARNGQDGHAREVLSQLRDLARSRYVPGTALATVHATLGEAGPALDALDRAYRQRDARLVFLKDDPLLADLRSEPRVIALMKKLGLDRFGRGLSPV